MPSKRLPTLALCILGAIAACEAPAPLPPAPHPAGASSTAARTPPPPMPAETLAGARRGFRTTIIRPSQSSGPAPEPPPAIFSLVHYPAPDGQLAAYITPDPQDGERYPAMVWMTGGDTNAIGEMWADAPRSNDQTAAAFRRAGIVLMFPSLRGGNDNPGTKEGFLGEADDVLAAADWLGQRRYVDPQRIYLGGHSTGGTLVLLVAAQSERFRATFAFGPVADIAGYGPELLPFDLTDRRELRLRSPQHWLHGIRTPTFVFEGRERPSNLGSLQALQAASDNPHLHCFDLAGADHFSILAPATERIAMKILLDAGTSSNIAFGASDLLAISAAAEAGAGP